MALMKQELSERFADIQPTYSARVIHRAAVNFKTESSKFARVLIGIEICCFATLQIGYSRVNRNTSPIGVAYQ